MNSDQYWHNQNTDSAKKSGEYILVLSRSIVCNSNGQISDALVRVINVPGNSLFVSMLLNVPGNGL